MEVVAMISLVLALLATTPLAHGQDMSLIARDIGMGPYVAPVDMVEVDLTQPTFLSNACVQAFAELPLGTLVNMVDAMGKPGAGVLKGNLKWFGDYLGCTGMPEAKYCLAGFVVNESLVGYMTKPAVALGLCLPKQCSDYDSAVFLFHLSEVAHGGALLPLAAVSEFLTTHIVPRSNVAVCEKGPTTSTGTAVTFTLVAVLLILLLVGTFVDWFHFSEPAVPQSSYQILNENRLETGSSAGEMGAEVGRLVAGRGEKMPLLAKGTANVHQGSRALHFLLGLLRCFSVPRKLNIILAAKHKAGTIPCLHGLRVMSMLWVILGHTYVWPFFVGEANPVDSYKIVTRTSFQFVLNGTFSVDTFFFLSGLLVMFLTLKHLEGSGGSLKWHMFYIHRFLRLTPLYMFVILFYVHILPFLGDGPMWSSTMTGMSEPCRKYWWTNLLYINNFYPHSMNAMCIGWSWYLANDMQFFIISPLVIMAAYRYRRLGLAVTVGFLVVGCMIVRGVLTSHYNFIVSASAFGGGNGGGMGMQLDAEQDNSSNHTAGATPETYNSQDVLYTKPYTRVATYAIGMAVGYLFRQQHRVENVLPRPTRIALAAVSWVVAALLLCLPLYSLTDMYKTTGTLSLAQSVAYQSFSRTSWGLGLAILVVLCHFGYGGYINSFLSHSLWIPLSRLTYGAYLLHPIMLFLIYLGMDQAVYFTDTTMAFLFMAAGLAAYVSALLFSVVVEYPLLELEMHVIGR